MVNALANHGYLPRDGKNVSLAVLITGAKDGINLAPDTTLLVGIKALQTSSTGNFLTFHLDDLNKHGSKYLPLSDAFPHREKKKLTKQVIEHDGSLSRQDFASGDNHSFSPEVFHQFISRFPTDGTISIEAAAEARAARLADAKASNPSFDLGADGARFSAIESSLYQVVFGQGTEGHARVEWVRTLFEQERLPVEEGWSRSAKALTTAQILEVQKKIEAVDTTSTSTA